MIQWYLVIPVGVAQYITIHSLKPQFYETESVRVVIGLWNLENFPFSKCASGNKALNFLMNFWDISESFLESVLVGTFLVFFRKFPRKCASGYVPPIKLFQVISTSEFHEY